MPPCGAAILRFLFIAGLVCAISAANDPLTRLNPRGWAAAHQASQELLASLAAKASSATIRLSAKTLPITVSGERSSVDSYVRRDDEFGQKGNTRQQLALLALALALLAFALGWCAAWQFFPHANVRHVVTASAGRHTVAEGPRMKLLAQERTPPGPTTMQPVSILGLDGDFSGQELYTGSQKTGTRLLGQFEATESRTIASVGVVDVTSATAGLAKQLAEDVEVASAKSQPSEDRVSTESGRANDTASQHGQQGGDAASSSSEQHANAPAHLGGQVQIPQFDCEVKDGESASSTGPFLQTLTDAHPKQDASPSSSQPTQAANTMHPDGGSSQTTGLPHGHGTTSATHTPQAQPPASTSAPGWLLSAQQKALTRQHPEAIDDVTVIMAALAQRLRLDADALTGQERMQLLQMALQCCQHRESSWLHIQANELRLSQAEAAHGTLAHKRQQAALREEARQIAAFRASLEDGLLTGLCLMLVATVACGVRCGFLGRKLSRCQPVASVSAMTFWRPWAILELGSIMFCWTNAASEVLLGVCIMLATAYVALRSGLLRGAPHEAPLLKLTLGFGVICAFTGYFAVAQLGGEPQHWLAAWEAWVAMQLLASWQLPTLHRALISAPLSSAKSFFYQAVVAIVLPMGIGMLPFAGCFTRFQHWLLGVQK